MRTKVARTSEAEPMEVDVTLTTPQRWQALRRAVNEGNLEYVELLLMCSDVHPDVRFCASATALHLAAKAGRTAICKALLAAGADANALDGVRASTPLHLASAAGHYAVVQLLLNSGADLNVLDVYEMLPLDLAVTHDHAHAVELLLDAGAPPLSNSKLKWRLYRAAALGYSEVVAALLSPILKRERNGREGSQYLINCALINTTTSDEPTAGHVATLKLLLAQAPAVDCRSELGAAPLHFAAGHGLHYGPGWAPGANIQIEEGGARVGLVEALLSVKHITINARDIFGITPLLYAAWNGYVHVAERLIQAGADLPADFQLEGAPMPKAGATLVLAKYPHWDRIPAPCPGLEAALSAVWQRSKYLELPLLFARLEEGVQRRIHMALLCLQRRAPMMEEELRMSILQRMLL